MRVVVLGLAGLLLCGCSGDPVGVEQPGVSAEATAELEGSEFLMTGVTRWEAMGRVEQGLLDRGFAIARVDRRFGVIESLPAPVPVAGEFWEGPGASGSESAVATLSAMRRVARARVEDVEGGVLVTLRVEHERMRHADRRMSGSFGERVYYDTQTIAGSSSGSSTRSFGGSFRTGDPRHERSMWVPAGRDVGLERRMLKGM